jgi:hypothetical protein
MTPPPEGREVDARTLPPTNLLKKDALLRHVINRAFTALD